MAMHDTLREQLKRAGWKPGRFKGFLQTRRAGIEFDLGQPRGGDRLELRYRYVTENTTAEGDVALPADVTLERIGDAMTGVYLRVHERPEASRTFGMGQRRRPSGGPGAANPPPASPETAEAAATQLEMNLDPDEDA